MHHDVDDVRTLVELAKGLDPAEYTRERLPGLTLLQWAGPESSIAALLNNCVGAYATADPALAGHHRVDAIRAHLLDRLGDVDAARELYRCAARRTLSIPEQRYLLERATSKGVDRLRHPGTAPGRGAGGEERP